MIFKLISCTFLILSLIVKINCVQVFENNGENVTITEPLLKDLNSEITTVVAENLKSEEPKSVQQNNESENETSELRITTSPTTTVAQKIPPTLTNMKFERNTERPEKSLKDIA